MNSIFILNLEYSKSILNLDSKLRCFVNTAPAGLLILECIYTNIAHKWFIYNYKKIHILYYNIVLDYSADYRVEPGG
jgi:hypothetical protein